MSEQDEGAEAAGRAAREHAGMSLNELRPSRNTARLNSWWNSASFGHI